MASRTKRFLLRLIRGQEGAAFSEYGLLLVFIVIAIAIGGTTFSSSITTFLNGIGDYFTSVTPTAGGGQ